MSPASFPTIPSELICQVFELLDQFSDVASLAQTGRTFYNTWRKHAMPIARAVGFRSFPGFAEAERLLNAQEEAEGGFESRDDRQEKSIKRAKRLLSNARCAAAACADWVNFCEIQDTVGAAHRGGDGAPEASMRPSECARFERTFYTLWTVGIMQNAAHMQTRAHEILDSCTAQDLIRLDELAMWCSGYNDNEFGNTGLDLRDQNWKAGYDIVGKYWKAYLDEGTSTPGPDGHYTPMGMFAFFDHTQYYLELYKERQSSK